MPNLPPQKKAQRLRIYISESDRWRGKPLDTVLLETLRAQGMAGATVFRGVAGFGAHSRIHTTAIEVLSIDLPVVIETIDSPEKITAILEIITPMVREGLITLEDVEVIKYTHRFLNPLPADQLVSEVMTRDVLAINEDEPVSAAWKQMLDKQVKAMPVLDGSGRVVGIVTDEDLLDRAAIRQRLSVAIRMDRDEIEHELRSLQDLSIQVKEVMSHPVVTALSSESLGIATTRMVKGGLKRLPVVDKERRLAGMLSRLDILQAVAHSKPLDHQVEQHIPQAGRVIGNIMARDFPTANQDDDLSAIIDKFGSSNSHRLVVVNTQGKAIGLLSDSDVVTRVQASSRKSVLDALRQRGKPAPGKETAFDLMSPGPLTAPPDLPVLDAVRLILAESRKWLVVVDENEKPLGLVDRQMLLEAVSS